MLAPDAGPALQIAAVMHDIERAFPAAGEAPGDGDPLSSAYNAWHQERCARVGAAWLREQGASAELIDRVSALIRHHEDGGWPDADILQAADSLAFLEVQAELFEQLVAEGSMPREQALRKVRWMYERVTIRRAQTLAAPMLPAALERIAAVAIHSEPAAPAIPAAPEPATCGPHPS